MCNDGSGACTLRAAVQESNTLLGSDTIDLPASTFQLTEGTLGFAESVTIYGSGPDSIIQGDGTHSVLSVVEVDDNVALELQGVTVRGGTIGVECASFGNPCQIELDSVVLTEHSQAAVYVAYGSFSATNSTFSFSEVAVILEEGWNVDLQISNSWVHHNGGGVHCGMNASCQIEGSILEENTGRVASVGYEGNLFVRESIIRNNSGGGLSKEDNDSGLQVIDSAIYGNTAGDGGGINIDACYGASIENSTISGNTATGSGGGLYIEAGCAETWIRSSTVTGNVAGGAGGGIFVAATSDGGTVNMHNSILAGNRLANGSLSDCAGDQSLISHGYNLIGTLSGCLLTGDTTGNVVGADPVIAPLRNNGGFTPTHALLAVSPAIDAGSCTPADQRAVSRPQGAACDIGAYESVCASEPRATGCRVAPKAAVGLSDEAADAKDKLTWKWAKGDGTLLGDFGDPVSATEYSVCIHDTSAGTPSLAAALRLPPTNSWSVGTTGHRYRDKTGARDGITGLKLRAGIDGQPRLLVKAQGANLALPGPAASFQYFDQEPEVSVQLLTSEGTCWTSEFEVSETSKNNASGFKAR